MPKLITKRIKIIKPTSKSKPSAKYSVAAAAEECGILTYDPSKKTAKAKSRAVAAAVKAKKNTASSFLFEDEGGADYQDGLSRLRQLRFEMACRPSVGTHPSLIPPHTDIVSGANNCGRMDMNQNNNIAPPPSLSYHDAVALALLRGSPHIIDTTSGLSPSVGVTAAIQRGNNPRLINPKNRRENDENGSQSSSDIKNKKGERTAGNRVRHFLQHNYRDLASEPTLGTEVGSLTCDSFPMILHKILDNENYVHIISWQPHGRAFIIRDWTLFQQFITPKYFPRTKKVASLKRQFNLYGFKSLSKRGPDQGAYYHEAFLRGMPELTQRSMVRKRIKGTGHKACSNPDAEPDLYSYPFVMEGGKLLRSWQSSQPTSTSLSSLRSMLNK